MPQPGIEPATYWSLVRHPTNWASLSPYNTAVSTAVGNTAENAVPIYILLNMLLLYTVHRMMTTTQIVRPVISMNTCGIPQQSITALFHRVAQGQRGLAGRALHTLLVNDGSSLSLQPLHYTAINREGDMPSILRYTVINREGDISLLYYTA